MNQFYLQLYFENMPEWIERTRASGDAFEDFDLDDCAVDDNTFQQRLEATNTLLKFQSLVFRQLPHCREAIAR